MDATLAKLSSLSVHMPDHYTIRSQSRKGGKGGKATSAVYSRAMDRRSVLKFMASLPLVGLFFRSKPALAGWQEGPERRVAGVPELLLTSMTFRVTSEELKTTWVEQLPNAFVPESGLIRRFRDAMKAYEGCGVPVQQEGCTVAMGAPSSLVEPGRLYVEFQDEAGKPWGQPHNMILPTKEVLKGYYPLIDRALCLLRKDCRTAGIEPDLDRLRYVQVRFLHNREAIQSPNQQTG
jgi:hypothetical protein